MRHGSAEIEACIRRRLLNKWRLYALGPTPFLKHESEIIEGLLRGYVESAPRPEAVEVIEEVVERWWDR